MCTKLGCTLVTEFVLAYRMTQNVLSCVDAIFTTRARIADGNRIVFLVGIIRKVAGQTIYLVIYVATL
jgi:hypothetical protein